MKTLGYKEFEERLQLLKQIENVANDLEAFNRYLEEMQKLCHADEQLFLPGANSSSSPKMGSKLFRSTTEFKGFDKTLTSYFSHPDSENTPLGRCNISKYPTFYCSDNGNTSLSEKINNIIKKEEKIEIYLSEWEITTEKKWNLLPVIFVDLPLCNRAHEYVSKNLERLNSLYEGILSKDDITEYINYYHEVFTQENDYKFSSIISHNFLFQGEGDYIIYPSVQHQKFGNNYAFNIKHVHNEFIKLNKVHKFRAEIDNENDLIKWYLQEIGMVNGNKINWRPATEEDVSKNAAETG